MKSTPNSYPFSEIEKKWQQHWEEKETFQTPNPDDPNFDASKPKFYVLDMFPYPSGDGLHVGHPEGYTATDIISRYKKMKGYNVLHPMGWDAFGLPAEQHAIKTGEHPSESTQKNIETFRKQLKSLGFSYDWKREINTTDPEYIKWTQWIFLQIYESYFNQETQKAHPVSQLREKGWTEEEIDEVRLAYVAETLVNWSPDLGTVLANEEIEEWQSKGFKVERKPLKQWMLRITAYAQRLLKSLDQLDWQESIKTLQRNWIGKSEGANIRFSIKEVNIECFSTRPDTIYGATYLVLAPEHPFVKKITTPEQKEKVEAYCQKTAEKSDLQRTDLNKEKSGIFTGAFAIHPLNRKKLPIWISDYVLSTYGTGAIMAVPAHDLRDLEFAEKFQLPIIKVIKTEEQCFTGEGTAINSEELNGLSSKEAKEKAIQILESKGKGERKTTYKLRDWLFSRQRYWGEPFPILWEGEKHSAICTKELPVLAPHLDDYRPTGKPQALLNKATEWVRYSAKARRETNTMPQWAGSCWYYLRYCDPHNQEKFIGKEAENYWLKGKNSGGVDLYIGGAEHAVLHLLYARFWHKILYDLEYVSTPEPFQKLVNQGLIFGEDGQKMSKSRGNVISPDEIIKAYGADALRLYEMFLGPLEQNKPWNTQGIEGISRFLARVWRLGMQINQSEEWESSSKISEEESSEEIKKILHQTIDKVSRDIENLQFNTAISQMMICSNALTKAEKISEKDWISFLKILSPFAPHMSEELYWQCSQKNPKLPQTCICEQKWEVAEKKHLSIEASTYVIQINGKLRAKLETPPNTPKESVQKQALKIPNIQKYLHQQKPQKTIFVPNRLINFVLPEKKE